MTLFRRLIFRLVVSVIVAIGSTGEIVRAQNGAAGADEVEKEPRAIAPKKVVGNVDPIPRPERLAMYKLVLEKRITEFDQTEGGIEAHFLRRLGAELEELEHACRLTPVQTKKLQLAGRAEIKRWMDRLDRLGRDFVESPAGDVANLRAEMDKLLADADGLFRMGSFMSKAVVATLSPEQLRARNVHRYEQSVSRTVKKLARSVHLSDEQSEKLLKVLLNETKPPAEFGQFDYALVLFQASRLPEPSLRGIFDESQWKMFQRQIASGAGTEAFLKQEGYEFGDQVLHLGPAFSEPRVNPAKSKN